MRNVRQRTVLIALTAFSVTAATMKRNRRPALPRLNSKNGPNDL